MMSNPPTQYPDQLLEIRVHKVEPAPPVTVLCAGYEGGRWRSNALAEDLFEWVPYVALNQTDQNQFGMHNYVKLVKRACNHIYRTQNSETRGELGELLLHIACVQFFGTSPILCKMILKTSGNDVVKGFDGVHVLSSNQTFEIWLGESKFYRSARRGISDAISSIEQHIAPIFLNHEKAMIVGHVNSNVPQEQNVRRLFDEKTSTDNLLSVTVFPILIAYESDSTRTFDSMSGEYVKALKAESEKLRQLFLRKNVQNPLRFQLIFVPMKSKANLIKQFDRKLRAFL